MTRDRGELVQLVRELARLLSERSETPRGKALGFAHQKVRAYAEKHGLPEEFCDQVLLMFLSGRHDILVAA